MEIEPLGANLLERYTRFLNAEMDQERGAPTVAAPPASPPGRPEAVSWHAEAAPTSRLEPIEIQRSLESSWYICPFGPHVVPMCVRSAAGRSRRRPRADAAVRGTVGFAGRTRERMRQHLATMHFEEMEPYYLEADQARLVPKDRAPPTQPVASAYDVQPIRTVPSGRGRGMPIPLPAQPPARPYVSAAEILQDPVVAEALHGAGVLGPEGLGVYDDADDGMPAGVPGQRRRRALTDGRRQVTRIVAVDAGAQRRQSPRRTT